MDDGLPGAACRQLVIEVEDVAVGAGYAQLVEAAVDDERKRIERRLAADLDSPVEPLPARRGGMRAVGGRRGGKGRRRDPNDSAPGEEKRGGKKQETADERNRWRWESGMEGSRMRATDPTIPLSHSPRVPDIAELVPQVVRDRVR